MLTIHDFSPAVFLAMVVATPAKSLEATILPSGRAVTFQDVIHGAPGPAGLTIRFRFLETDLADVIGATPYVELEADMHHLCESYALTRISNIGPQPAQIVISISDRKVAFGAHDPSATQVFEAYRPDAHTCVWEMF